MGYAGAIAPTGADPCGVRPHPLRVGAGQVLERSIVAAITEREGLLEALGDAMADTQRTFQDTHTTRRPTQADLADMLSIMNERACRPWRSGCSVCRGWRR